MALATADLAASFDETARRLDLSPVLSAILLNDTAFLGLVGMGEMMLDTDHRWNEDSLNAPQVTGAEALDASDTTFDIASGHGSRLRVGALLMDIAAGKSEIIQVTAISTDQLTVVRGYGSSSGETHADAAVYHVIGSPVQEGDETITDKSKARSQKTQYPSIFKETVKISGTREAVTGNGIHPGVSSEVKHQVMRRLDEMKVQMNMSALFSVISGDAGSDTSYRSMKGLREYLTAANGNNTSTAEALSEDVLNLMVRAAWDDGGNPKDLVGHAEQLTRASAFNAQRLRVAPSDRVAGTFVSKFLSSLGIELTFTIDRWFRKDEVALIQKELVWFAPLKGRQLTMEPLARIGDAHRWQLLAEGGLICKNALEAHAYHTNLAVS